MADENAEAAYSEIFAGVEAKMMCFKQRASICANMVSSVTGGKLKGKRKKSCDSAEVKGDGE